MSVPLVRIGFKTSRELDIVALSPFWTTVLKASPAGKHVAWGMDKIHRITQATADRHVQDRHG
jgi:hypothetical protein